VGIAVLGPMTVDGDANALGPRDRVVLAALAAAPGQVLTRDQLADALWGERPPASWNKVVQGCVVRLRKTLGVQAIETLTQGYRLVVSSDELDAMVFERLVGRGRELLTLGEKERSSYVLGKALALWRGPALVDLDGWETGRIEAGRLEELRLDAEELRLDAALQAGHHREVLAEAQELVAEAPVRERRWALLALAQYQAGRQAEALRTLHRVRTVLSNELGLDPGPDLVALEQAILRQDPSLVVAAALPEPSASCPYQGLMPYDVDDSEGFFGRDADLTACLERLTTVGVLAVVGPSGSGKSSLVRAGVTAARRRDGHRTVVVSPGAHPMDALAVLPAKGPVPLLVVDQCEEAFSLCDGPAERAEFFTALSAHAAKGELVVALRADRTGDVSAHPDFARLVERGLYLLGAMAEDDLRAAIEGPARQAGLPLEPGLVDLLVRDVEGEPGALPLLSHALRETWLRREGRTLTVGGYRDTGGIRGAVAQSAEDVYERVDPERRPALRDLLLRLVAPTGEGEPVRSRLPRHLVATDDEHERLIELLVGARLVTSDDGVVELAHEALARAWPRLRGWLDDDTEGQRTLHHLTVAADAWAAMGRPDSELYRGVRLARALEWRDRAGPQLTATEQAFLTASSEQAETELQAAKRRAEQEARARRRTRRLATAVTGVAVLALLAAGLALNYQRDATARAADAAAASTLADANRLAALSTTVDELDLSLLLAAEAARTADTPETRDGLLTALVEHRRATRVTPVPGQAIDVALGDHGRTLFADLGHRVVTWPAGSTAKPRTAVDDWYSPENIDASPETDTVVVLGLADGQPRAGVFTANGEKQLLVEGHELGGWPQEVAFSHDGRSLLFLVANQLPSGSWEGSVREVRLGSGTARTIHTGVVRSSGPKVWIDATFADDGSAVAVWTREVNGRVAVLDLDDGSRTRLHVDPRPTDSLGFVPLSTGVAQLWADGAVTLYDGDGRQTQVLDVHQEPVEDILVATDGTWAATTGADGVVVLWDVDAATGLWSRRESLTGHGGAVTDAELTPDGRTLLTASRDESVISWDVSADAGLGSSYPGLRDRWISNRPEVVVPGRLLVAPTRPVSVLSGEDAAGRDAVQVAATFLDPRTGRVVDQIPVGKTHVGALFGSSVAVSPDRSMVAVTYGDATTVLDSSSRAVLGRIAVPATGQRGPSGAIRHETVWAAGWTRGGGRLLLAADGNQYDSRDGGLVVVDAATWTVERRVDLGGSVQVIEQSPDGTRLAVGNALTETSDTTPQLWILDSATLETEHTLRLGDDDFPYDLSFSPDGRWLAAVGTLGRLTVFDTATWAITHDPVAMHDQFAQQVEWTPDGRTVVTSGADGQVSLYDPERDLVRAVPLPGSADVEVSSNNLWQGFTHLVPGTSNEIVALSGERPGHRYPMNPSVWLTQACAIAGRDLTEDEWARYLPNQPYRRTCTNLP